MGVATSGCGTTAANRDGVKQPASRVLSVEEVRKIHAASPTPLGADLILVSRTPAGNALGYSWNPVKQYLAANCRPEQNDCASGVFPSDCTHFICHALNKAGVFVKIPSADCMSGLCIRVNELAESFFNSTNKYPNVQQLSSHLETKEGDFCFIPSWFGLGKNHAIVLAETATETGGKVWGHTNARCVESVAFDGQDCIYYRITDPAT
jgi:hypothetical protein